MKTGILIKKIRLSKNRKSKEIYHDILSRPAVSRFERGESDTTTSKLFSILHNLNLTLEEFYYLYSQDQPDFMILDSLSEQYYSGEGEGLLQSEKVLTVEYEKTSQLKYLHYACLAHFFAYDLLALPYPRKQVAVIKDYLFNVQTWNYYELILFNNSLDVLPFELADAVYEKVRQKMKDLAQLKRYKNELFSLINNLLVKSIQNNEIEKCKFYYEELERNTGKDKTRMYERSMLVYFKELLLMMEEGPESRENIDTVIAMFGFLGMNQKQKQCLQLVEEVQSRFGRSS